MFHGHGMACLHPHSWNFGSFRHVGAAQLQCFIFQPSGCLCSNVVLRERPLTHNVCFKDMIVLQIFSLSGRFKNYAITVSGSLVWSWPQGTVCCEFYEWLPSDCVASVWRTVNAELVDCMNEHICMVPWHSSQDIFPVCMMFPG